MYNNRQLYINGQEIYLDDDEIIPIIKQANNIAELKDRQADFTTDFKIPDTRANRRILEQANLISSQTLVPYAKNSCTYVQDGVELIIDGYLVLLSYANGYFSASAYSGNADFWKLIDKLKLSSLDTTELNHYWLSSSPSLFFGTTTKPDMRYLIFEPSDKGDLLGSTIDFKYLRPFVKTKRLFQQIVWSQGWSINGNIDFIDSWTMCTKLVPSTKDANGEVRLKQPIYNITSDKYEVKFSDIVEVQDKQDLFKNYLVISPRIFPNILTFKANRIGKWRITISGQVLFTSTGIDIKFGDNVIASNNNPNTVQDFEVVYEQDIDESNILWTFRGCEFGLQSAGTLNIYDLKIKAQAVELSIQEGDLVEVSGILPDMEQSKFLKSIANQYGLVFEADSQTRTLDVWRFDDLINNVPYAKDWSKYLSEGSEVLTYRVGDYAQQNVLKYKTSDEVPSGYADGILYVDNQTLENTKDLFTLDFNASLDILKNNKNVCLIPIYEKDENEYKAKDVSDVRVVKARQVNGTLTIAPSNIVLTSWYQTYFIDTSIGDGLGFNYTLIADSYTALANMINQAKKIEVKMQLPLIEIQSLKHSIPVYLSQFAAYFYVNKVNQWQKDKLCTVELIRIA